MKVAIDISQIVHEGTGVATYTRNLVYHLSKRSEVNLFLFGYSYGQYEKLVRFCEDLQARNTSVAYKILKLPEKIVNILWNDLHIIALERMIGPVDIVHTSDWIEPPAKAKKITTIHDLIVYKYTNTSHPYIIKTQQKKINWVKKEENYVIADSQSTKVDITMFLQIPKDRITVVYPGVEAIYKPKGNHIVLGVKKKYGIKGDYILSVGTQEPRKNVKAVVDAFVLYQTHPLIDARVPQVELVIVGKAGWGSQTFLPKSVRSVGFIDTQDLSALYSGALMLVYPSLYEGFGLPVLEAMKCGCPVICSNKGSLQEIGNEACVLVNPDDVREISRQMVTLTLNKKNRLEWADKGKRRAEEFSWEKTTDKMVAIYQKLNSSKI